MKSRQPSITAENNAAVRAYEAMRPAAHRICHDPFARYFLSDELCRAADQKSLLRQMVSRWNLVVPGVCDSILARTRFVDERLTEAIDRGLQQLVIVGAGYDTRAFRFDRLKERISIFELDHPSTQQVKLERLRENRLCIPHGAVFIPCRFEKEDFSEKLLSGGYDPGQITFFIWEGVTYYLPAPAVDRALAFMARHSPDGSAVVFDYFPPSVVNGTCRLEDSPDD